MCVWLTYSAMKWVLKDGSNAPNSRGKPAVSPRF